MNEQCRTHVGWVAAVIVLSISAPALAEGDEAPQPEAIKTEFIWVASEAGKTVGTERLKGVISPTKKRFLSTEVTPDKGQDAKRITGVHWRDPDGTLRKYFRKVEVRLGKGIRAFRRGVGIRIVGINQKLEPVEIPKASEHHIWDPAILAGLAVWLENASTAGETSFKVLDIAQRSSVTARMVPVETMTVGDPDGKAAVLNCWKAWAGGAEVATLCGDGAGILVSVKAGRRSLLLKDWTWAVPLPKPVEPLQDGADASGSSADAGKSGEETGVGP